jgi:uncharacterized protein YgbK (DUF1537 family)
VRAVRLIIFIFRIVWESLQSGQRLNEQIQFVLRGDSTLRGHVFAESEAFLEPDSIILFVPAFPDGGRTTRDGVHFVRINGKDLPADQTEYAQDPVFPFTSAQLTTYVKEKSGRNSTVVTLEDVRSEAPLLDVLCTAAPGSVVLPDAVTNDDIRCIARAVKNASDRGASIVVRSAAPLAAALAGVESTGLLALPLPGGNGPALLVCGSHTAGATAQLEALESQWGQPLVVNTDAALHDPIATGKTAAQHLAQVLNLTGLAMLASDRARSTTHNTLEHGERVMTALTTAVSDLRHNVATVISKGGITSAEVARNGLKATRATVLGQILPGVSVWSIDVTPEHAITYVVVPGNVGGEDTLARILQAVQPKA